VPVTKVRYGDSRCTPQMHKRVDWWCARGPYARSRWRGQDGSRYGGTLRWSGSCHDDQGPGHHLGDGQGLGFSGPYYGDFSSAGPSVPPRWLRRIATTSSVIPTEGPPISAPAALPLATKSHECCQVPPNDPRSRRPAGEQRAERGASRAGPQAMTWYPRPDRKRPQDGLRPDPEGARSASPGD
jgi:hypothetical protein